MHPWEIKPNNQTNQKSGLIIKTAIRPKDYTKQKSLNIITKHFENTQVTLSLKSTWNQNGSIFISCKPSAHGKECELYSRLTIQICLLTDYFSLSFKFNRFAIYFITVCLHPLRMQTKLSYNRFKVIKKKSLNVMLKGTMIYLT